MRIDSGALRWCPMAIGHHEVDRLHGLAGGLKITRAGGDRLGPALLHRDRNPAARSPRTRLSAEAGGHSKICTHGLACRKLGSVIEWRLCRVFKTVHRRRQAASEAPY